MTEKQLAALSLDLLIMLHCHDVLNKIRAGEEVSDCKANAAVKEVHDDMKKTALPVVHAVMLVNELEALSSKYDWFNVHIDRTKLESVKPLLDIAKLLVNLKYENEDSVEDANGIYKKFVKFIVELIKKSENEKG